MGDRSGIEWTEATWNPLVGCARVSPGCDHCYAERQSATRLSRVPAYAGLTEDGTWTGEVRYLRDRLEQPIRWRRPRRIFVNSMSDLFAPGVDDHWLAEILAVMSLTPRHTYQILTKRPRVMAGQLTDEHGELRYKMSLARKRLDYGAPAYQWPLPNVWWGTSIESQQYAFRARHLLETPAAVRFVSAEPLIGPLDMTDLLMMAHPSGEFRPPVDWVIVGGESGPGARPMHPEWARTIRDDCHDAGVPFLFKQWGEWAPERRPPLTRGPAECLVNLDGRVDVSAVTSADGHARMYRVGKHEAGRELDGRTWDEYPA